jgi:hypothetical protein
MVALGNRIDSARGCGCQKSVVHTPQVGYPAMREIVYGRRKRAFTKSVVEPRQSTRVMPSRQNE